MKLFLNLFLLIYLIFVIFSALEQSTKSVHNMYRRIFSSSNKMYLGSFSGGICSEPSIGEDRVAQSWKWLVRSCQRYSQVSRGTNKKIN